MEGTTQVSEDDTDTSESPPHQNTTKPTLRGELKRLSMSFNPEATDSFARMQAPTPTAIQGRGDSPVANRTRDKTEPVSSRLREQANTLIDYWCGIQRSKCAQWDSLGPRALKEYAYLAGDLDQTEEDFGGAEMVPLEKRKDVLKCPFKFNEAWNHPCPFQRKQWRKAIDCDKYSLVN
jgi:hypothetical protein